MAHLPHRQLAANTTFFRSSVIADKLFVLFKHSAPGTDWQRHKVSTPVAGPRLATVSRRGRCSVRYPDAVNRPEKIPSPGYGSTIRLPCRTLHPQLVPQAALTTAQAASSSLGLAISAWSSTAAWYQ
jgi:hypothetical protein